MDEQLCLRFDGCMATNIEQAYHRLERVYERLIGPLGLTVLEWYTLRALYAEDGMPASKLASCVCRHPSSMTPVFGCMEHKNLLRREVDADDRRSVRIFLTDAGRSLQPRVEIVAGQVADLLHDQVTPEQLQTFQTVLAVLQNVSLPGDE
jgi:DNA-binding MarR family transcriptional regulator